MSNRLISLRVDEEDKRRWARVAAERGLTLTELMRRGTALLAALDGALLERLGDYGRRLSLPEHLVIQNLLLERLAREAAREEVLGPGPRLLREFVVLSEGLLTGEALFESLKRGEVQRLSRQEVSRYEERLPSGRKRKGLNMARAEEELRTGLAAEAATP